MKMIVFKMFFRFSCLYLQLQLLKQSYLGWNFFFLSKKRHKTNLKVFQYHILVSVKRSEKQLASKANFSTICKLNARILC